VVDRESLDRDRADLLVAAGSADSKVDVVQTVLCETVLDERCRVRRRVDGHPALFEEVGQGADVVFVPMGDDDGVQPLGPLMEPREIGMHQLSTNFVGETNPAVDGDARVAADEDGAVHANLVESA